MKQIAVWLFILLLPVTLRARDRNEKETLFVQTIKEVLKCLEHRDSVALHKFTHPETGVYVLHRMGLMGRYTRIDAVGFSDTTPILSAFYRIVHDLRRFFIALNPNLTATTCYILPAQPAYLLTPLGEKDYLRV